MMHAVVQPRLIYAASERSADLFYATQFFAPDPFLFVQDGHNRRHMVVSALEVDRARRSARVDEVHEWRDIRQRYRAARSGESGESGESDETGDEARLIAFFLKERAILHVVVPDDFPLGLALSLKRFGLHVTPVGGPFWPERQYKRPEEVMAIQEALALTGDAMAVGIALIRSARIGQDGWLYHQDERLSSERVRADMNAFLVRRGAMPQHTIVAGGEQGADPHEVGEGPLPAHQPIILDIFPRMEKSGYWGDMTRTVCRGRPSERLQRAWSAVQCAQEVAFTHIRAGADGQDVHTAVCDHLTHQGFPTGRTKEGRQEGFFHGTGHGLGLEVHEMPRISQRKQKLEEGHVVTVEPGLYYPDMGGVRLEDVVVVEADGCRNLTQFPKYLALL